MKRIYHRLIFMGLLLALFSSCDESKRSVRVLDSSGEPLAGVPVQMVAMDNSGDSLATLATGITDQNGFVILEGFQGDFGSSIGLKALLPSGTLRSFAVGEQIDPETTSAAQLEVPTIDIFSEAFVSAVINITRTDNGTGLEDFSVSELQYLMGLARQRLAARSDLAIDDAAALLAQLISELGRALAEAAGGSITAVPLSSVVADDVATSGPTFAATSNCSKDSAQFSGEFFVFDLQQDGEICNGEAVTGNMQDAFDGGVALSLTGDTFSGNIYFPGDTGLNPTAPNPPVFTQDGREVVFGPVTTDGLLQVTRKVLPLPDEDIVRYMEIINNPTGASVELDIRITGEFGLDSSSLLFAQNSPTIFDATSDYGALVTNITNANPPRPAVGFVIDGANGLDGADTVSFPPQNGDIFIYGWNNVTIAAGATVVYLHYVTLNSSQLESTSLTTLEAIYDSPNMSGFSATEINGLRNFPPTIGNVVGLAGSVSAGSTVTLANGSASAQVTALTDGSFKAAISAISGDQVSVTATDGTDTAVPVEE